jgi:hypothetical protein
MKFNPFLFLCLLVTTMSTIGAYVYYRSRFHTIHWLRTLTIAITLSLLLIGALWIFLGRHIPDQRALVFNCPVSDIRHITIASAPRFSLVDHDVIITNMQTIKDIMTAIRSAKICPPEHTSTRWSCFLVISTATGSGHIKVSLTPEQGAIIFCEISQEGFIYDTLQSDTLGHILEKAIEPTPTNNVTIKLIFTNLNRA